MVRLLRAWAVLAALLLAACETPYGAMGLTGGVSETKLTSDTYRITGRGNGYTDPARIQNFVLLRAAELALQNGFTHFAMMDENSRIKRTRAVIPGQVQANTFATANTFGNTTTVNAITTGTVSPPTVINFEKPRTDAVVQFFRSRKAAPAGVLVYDAREINSNLGPRLRE